MKPLISAQGEYVLDEAIDFTRAHLISMVKNLPSLAKLVEHALEIPLQKSMPRLEARYYITVYQDEESRNEALSELAKLDFNLLQSLHKREISDISRWWKSIDFTSKLPFARDRVVECYFWILGVYFEPQYTRGRMIVTKLMSIASAIDDIYDVLGTLDELKLFTDAIPRWDIEATNQLPEYMKVCYLALLNVVDEIEGEVTKEGRSYRVHYVKEAMNALCRTYFAEAIWYGNGYVPTLEEYLDVAIMSSGYPMLSVQALIDMGDVATKEAFDWVISIPTIVRAYALIARLVDDVQTHKVEQERGDAASAVQCYMKEHNVSEQEACKRLRKMVVIVWKDINKECLEPTPYPLPLLKPIVNLARVMEVLYQHGDGYSDSTGDAKRHIASLLVDPI